MANLMRAGAEARSWPGRGRAGPSVSGVRRCRLESTAVGACGVGTAKAWSRTLRSLQARANVGEACRPGPSGTFRTDLHGFRARIGEICAVVHAARHFREGLRDFRPLGVRRRKRVLQI